MSSRAQKTFYVQKGVGLTPMLFRIRELCLIDGFGDGHRLGDTHPSLSLYKFCKSLETHHIKDVKNIFTSETILGQELGPPAIDGSRSK